MNYVVHYLESDKPDKNKSIVNYINVLKLKWDVKYDAALEIIDKEIKGLKKGGLYYLLMKKDTTKEVVKKLLKRKSSAVSFYVFEGEEREEFVEISNNLYS